MIASPVTGGSSSFVRNLHVSVIERQYRRCHGIDVSGVFANCKDGSLAVRRCDDTGYMFYAPLGLEGGAAFYDALLDGGFEYVSTKQKEDHRYAREFILREQAASDSVIKVLDVGCGTGNFLQSVAETEGVTASGLEGSERARTVARSKGLTVEEASIAELALSGPEQYDVVCAFQVLEHVEDVRNFLSSLVTLTRPGGSIVLSVPNCDPFYLRDDYYAVSNVPPHHVGLWGLDALTALEKFFPLQLEDTLLYDSQPAARALAQRSVSAFRDRFPTVRSETIVKAVGVSWAIARLGAQTLSARRPRSEMSRALVRYRRTPASFES